jgi:hypothetical protein
MWISNRCYYGFRCNAFSVNQAGKNAHANFCENLELFATAAMPELHATEPAH